MAMKVRGNNAVVQSLSNTTTNVNRASKDMQKLATGLKLVTAADGASDYSISEKMRTMIRSLGQNVQNTQNGMSLLKVAEGAIQNIVDELRSMREIAINAANDHNTDNDRVTLQKEYEHRKASIDELVATTTYNGKLLLNGDYERPYTVPVDVTEPRQVQVGVDTRIVNKQVGGARRV